MKTLENSLRFGQSDSARLRLKILEHGKEFGWRSACHAFNVSRSSYFRWQKLWLESNKRFSSLIPKKTRPKRIRNMTTDWHIVQFICEFREQYGNVGSHKIKPFLDEYTEELNIKSISYRTIEKVIKRRNLFNYSPRIKKKSKRSTNCLRSKYAPKVKTSGFIEVDCITLYVLSQRHYFVSSIDVYTKLALVKKVPSLKAIYTKAVLEQFIQLLPYSIHTVQTDNGSEFFNVFDEYLINNNITHLFTYPHCPRTNGVVERFNRTIQEEFLERTDTLIYDLTNFHVKLDEWLNWYNTKRPHQALNYLSPMQFIQINSLK